MSDPEDTEGTTNISVDDDIADDISVDDDHDDQSGLLPSKQDTDADGAIEVKELSGMIHGRNHRLMSDQIYW